MTKPSAAAARKRPAFTPVPSRARRDGWTPERQVEFIEALAEGGCVAEACRRVGISDTAAYALRVRPTAQSFRQAWDVALETAIDRLSDAAFGRALHGVARPVFYKGEQIGERRYYDERLTQFLLRYRDPLRYGVWRDRNEYRQAPDAVAERLALSLARITLDATYAELGRPVPRRRPIANVHHVTEAEQAEQEQAEADTCARAAEKADHARRMAEFDAELDELDRREAEEERDVA